MISVNTLKGEKRKFTNMSMLIITELKISGWFLLSSLWFFWISHSTPDPTPTSPWPSSEQCPPGQWRGRGVGGASPDSDPDTETGLAAGGCRGGNTCCSGSHRVTLPIQSISKVLWLSGHLLLSKTPWDHRVLPKEETKTRAVTGLAQGHQGENTCGSNFRPSRIQAVATRPQVWEERVAHELVKCVKNILQEFIAF